LANQTVSNNSNSFPDILKEFQLAQLSIKEKSSPEIGKKISEKFWSYVLTGMGGYFNNRNARFLTNRNWSNGRMDIQAMFQDRFQMNAKQNYIRLNWQALQIIPRIISGLVGRWMERKEKIKVTAIDDLSVKEKREEYEQLEFIIAYKEKLLQLQEQTGIQFVPSDKDEMPEDKDELALWQAQFQRTAEEILYELANNDVLSANGWQDVLKEKMLHDSAEVGLVGTKTDMGADGVINVKWLKPENIVYTWSDYPDFRDTSIRGYMPSIKISELRKLYGKEFNPDNPLALSEEQLWTIAQTAQEFKNYSNISWQTYWVNTYLRPYDEWNVRLLEFEIKTVDKEPYTITKTKSTNSTYVQSGEPKTRSGKPKEKPSDNQEIVYDNNINIYEGCYLPDTQTLLKWGIKTNMIRPQDPKESGNAEFSYSFYMYQNFEMRNLAIPEKIESAVKDMILALLKMQQCISRMRPTGAAIDEDALQNIDYGLGDAANKSVDYKRVYDQTGDIYYRGRDAEGNRIPVPITELQNSGFLTQMDGLIRNYQFNYQILKDEIGEDPNLITSALQPRVTAQNVDASQQAAATATDYIPRAVAECMKITSRKISCLLKDSVTYGSQAYRHILKKEDIGLRQFTTDIEYLPTDMDVQKFEITLNNALASNPDLVLFLNPFQLMEMAKRDVKLAWMIYNRAQKKCLSNQKMVAQQNQEATFKAQIESAKAGEEGKQETERVKGDIDLAKVKMDGESANKTAVLTMVTGLLSKGMPIPPELQPLVSVTIENLMIPLATQNEQQKAEIIQKYREAQQNVSHETQEDTQIPAEQQQIQQSQQPDMAA